MDSTATMSDVSNYEGRTYAEPLAGLRVSWGSILAGTLALLATATILWALAVAIILTATNATASSIAGSLVALWITAMVTTLVGGFVGGWIAGYLTGNKSMFLGALHGFLAWALAFLVMTTVYFGTIGSAARVVTEVGATAASATVQAAGSAAGGVVGVESGLDQQAMNVLESLGYSRAESTAIVADAKTQIQRTLHGDTRTTTPSAAAVFGPVIDWGAGLAWSWWGTWLATSLLSVFGGVLAAKALGRRTGAVEHHEEREAETTTATAVTPPYPQPTT